jgi:two-component system chemotaxis sensor kinase CheA
MPIELTLDQMPHRLTVDKTQLQIDYCPIGTAEPHDRYLVIVTDVTAATERELAELERREAMAVFEHILSDRTGAETYFEDGSHTVANLTAGGSQDLAVTKRMLHTLKGNSALFGLDSIATLCHAIEDFIAETGHLPQRATYDALVERWARLTSDVERIVGHRARGVEVDAADYAALEASVKRKEPHAALLERVRGLRYEPVAKRLSHFAEQARRIAGRLEKEDLDVVVEDNGVRLDAHKWSAFWSSFIHAVRNAVDHGIETPSARLAAAKPAGGRLVLRAEQDAERTVIEIVDDGRGIDWEAVRERAVRLGLPVATAQDLERALFADGVSTAEAVTDVSGRGIGMGALAQGVHALGGGLAVESVPGAGTTLRVTIPRRSQRESLSPAA